MKASMKKSWTTTFAVFVMLAVAGCADVSGTLKKAQDEFNEAVSTAVHPSSPQNDPNANKLPEVLKGLFADQPFDDRSHALQFPLVAITINKVAPFYLEYTPVGGDPYYKGCFDVTAVVWKSKTNSSTLNFNWCTPENVESQINFGGFTGRGYNGWVVAPSLSLGVAMIEPTLKRTAGPYPPKSKFPTDPAHVRFFKRADPDTNPGTTATLQYCHLMLASLMTTMDFDFGDGNDYRVWVVKYSEAK